MLLFLALLAVVIGVVVGIVVSSRQKKLLNEAFARVARAHNGRFFPAGVFAQPTLSFSHEGIPVRLNTFSTGGKHPKHYTQLQIAWPDRDTRMEVFRHGFFSSIGQFLGIQDINLGSPDFDSEFVIRGNNEKRIVDLLSGTAQSRISELCRFLGNNDVYVSLSRGSLLIKKREIIRHPLTLERFVSMGLGLYEELRGSSSQGVDFVESSESESEPAICQICGEAVMSDVVRCVSCKTLHHGECWDYIGACSTYGCGQRKSRKMRRKLKQPRDVR